MLRLRRLYSQPEVFDPVTFFDGINLVIGDRSDDSRKTNGVGKSLMVEFLHFALLRDLKHSRVRLVPKDVLAGDVEVCLDLEMGGSRVTIRRSIDRADTPALVVDGRPVEVDRLEDATRFLTELLFDGQTELVVPSFRKMLGPLMRDERSEFKSIVKCHDTELRLGPDYEPHLYLLGIDIQHYMDAVRLYGDIGKASDAVSSAKKEVESLSGKPIRDAKAELNELTSQVERIQQDLDGLGVLEGHQILKDELTAIDVQLDEARARQGVMKSELSKIDLFKGDHYIDEDEVAELFDQFAAGLGTHIRRDLAEVTAFKKKIDDFQRSLLLVRRKSLLAELKTVDAEVAELGRRYSEKMSLLDQRGQLRSLRVNLAAHQRKVEDQARLSAVMQSYANHEREKEQKKDQRANAIQRLRQSRDAAECVIGCVERTILDIHEYVAGNRLSSFDVSVPSSTSRKKEPVEFTLRIHDDGSHSIEREKVFLYDLAMLINEETSVRHPGFLVHDNIFDVDQDTLVRSLNYLGDNIGLLGDKQYVLTISSDKLTSDGDLPALCLDVKAHQRAVYTKNAKFLRKNYQETGR